MNQSLVDDFLVSSDKIGAANFFWSFPSKRFQDQQVSKDNIEQHIIGTQLSLANIETATFSAKQTRNHPDRSTKLTQLRKWQEEDHSLTQKLTNLKFNDPEEINLVWAQAQVNQDACNRWTDNIWGVKAFFTKKKGLSGKEVRGKGSVVFSAFAYYELSISYMIVDDVNICYVQRSFWLFLTLSKTNGCVLVPVFRWINY